MRRDLGCASAAKVLRENIFDDSGFFGIDLKLLGFFVVDKPIRRVLGIVTRLSISILALNIFFQSLSFLHKSEYHF